MQLKDPVILSDQCPITTILTESDHAHENLQRLIASQITAFQSPSDSSDLENRQCQRKKEIKGKSWTCSGMILIDILEKLKLKLFLMICKIE